ncbi:MAG TPA: multidrug efflux SMR transporter [Cytophagaceae bacterium]
MNWLYLSLAILTEVIGTLLIRFSEGFAKVVPFVLIIGFYLLSYYFFTLSVKKIELGIAYAIWSGLGTALLTAAGVLFFNDVMTPSRIIAIILIIAGVLLLHLTGSSSGANA